MNKQDLERSGQYEKFVLVELPKSAEIREAFDQASRGEKKVDLVTKGFRPMFSRAYPFNFNEVWIEGYREAIPVPTICCLAGADPGLVQEAYFHFRETELLRYGLREGLRELHKEIAHAKRQIVTNLLPFPQITWLRQEGTGETHLVEVVEKNPPFLSEEEIRRACEQGMKAWKSIDRHLRKKYRR
ncbi:hypothetical protein HYW53_02885 [Candidatus Giovannonibacteria bacterium]|nr:hypothetical protein [Candidatus Giovannonibacteria bacterium]